MNRKDAYQRPRLLPVVLVLILFAGLWWMYLQSRKPALDPEAEPRAVTARGDLASDERSAIEIFQSVSPSVVYITSVELRRSIFTLNVYEIPRGTGSGFVWDAEGRIVTNYHVIGDASRMEVRLADGSAWAPAEQLQPIPVGGSRDLLVGQKVYAIGNPFGLDQTMTSGIVSALGREIRAVTGRTIQDVIQTDAAINPGNSGGPLLDSAGRLIGVNTAIFSPSGASAGIGFAVPVEEVNRVVPELIRYGRRIRPGIGITVAHEQLAERLGVEGVLVINIAPGSTAEAAGLQGTERVNGGIVLGDIIQRVNGETVTDFDELRNALDRHEVGEEVTLGILRGEREIQLSVMLEEVE
jgi:S1-C subfamily serine protease